MTRRSIGRLLLLLSACFWEKFLVAALNGARPNDGARLSARLDRRVFVTSSVGWWIAGAAFAAPDAPDVALVGSASAPDAPDVALVALVGQAYLADADLRKLFSEATVKESQGNVRAAQRLYEKVTRLAPSYVYGWSNLGNTQVIAGDLLSAEDSYTRSISLCRSSLASVPPGSFAIRKCDDLWLLHLNRGALRLNSGANMAGDALRDLQIADELRGKPDANILQNLARAEEMAGRYGAADRHYDTAISMTSDAVSPFWLRAGMVKLQIGDLVGATDLARRVEVKFPEAPEVVAALAAMQAARGDVEGGRRRWGTMVERQRELFRDPKYLRETVAWPPVMKKNLALVSGSGSGGDV